MMKFAVSYEAEGAFTMIYRTCRGIAGALAVLLPLVGAISPAFAEEAKSQPANTGDWCLTPAIAPSLAAKESRSISGKIVAIDAANRVVKIATEVKFAVTKTEGNTTQTVTETKTEVVEVTMTPKTVLLKTVKSTATPSKASDDMPSKPAPPIQLNSIKLSDLAAQQTIAVSARPVASSPSKANTFEAIYFVVVE